MPLRLLRLLPFYVSSGVREKQSSCLHSIAFLEIMVLLWPIVNNANDFYASERERTNVIGDFIQVSWFNSFRDIMEYNGSNVSADDRRIFLRIIMCLFICFFGIIHTLV